MYEAELKAATKALPPEVRFWMGRALEDPSLDLTWGDFEDGGGLCPMAGASALAGGWQDGELSYTFPSWGSPALLSISVEDFVAYFDLVCTEYGLGRGLDVVRAALESAGAARTRKPPRMRDGVVQSRGASLAELRVAWKQDGSDGWQQVSSRRALSACQTEGRVRTTDKRKQPEAARLSW